MNQMVKNSYTYNITYNLISTYICEDIKLSPIIACEWSFLFSNNTNVCFRSFHISISNVPKEKFTKLTQPVPALD